MTYKSCVSIYNLITPLCENPSQRIPKFLYVLWYKNLILSAICLSNPSNLFLIIIRVFQVMITVKKTISKNQIWFFIC